MAEATATASSARAFTGNPTRIVRSRRTGTIVVPPVRRCVFAPVVATDGLQAALRLPVLLTGRELGSAAPGGRVACRDPALAAFLVGLVGVFRCAGVGSSGKGYGRSGTYTPLLAPRRTPLVAGFTRTCNRKGVATPATSAT